MTLRRHQAEIQQIGREIRAGTQAPKYIIVSVTAGGGKSALPVILAKELIPRFADALCWVVPRIGLRKQAETSFLDQLWRIELPHNYKIRASTNEINPCRGLQGYVTTYQAVGENPTCHFDEFRTKRYVLFLDEPHHVERDGAWHRALQPIVDKAVLVIYASGTLQRGDGKAIAFLPYRQVDSGSVIDLTASSELAIIRYNRSDALRERAILPLHFEVMDGRAEWVNKDGDLCSVDSIAEAAGDTSAALMTALKTGYALELLEKTIKSWQQHKRVYRRAKLLVVAPKIEFANKYLAHLKEKGIDADIATSDDSFLAQNAIDRFKGQKGKREIDVLVTVMMAYEGLDVPQISHIACLTHIRSKPWLEQCFARACRTDEGKSHGYIFGPDDEMFRSVMEQIKAEQETVVKDPSPDKGGNGGDGPQPDGILAIGSELTGERSTSLTHGEDLGYQETDAILKAMAHASIGGVSPLQFRQALIELGVTVLPNGPNPVRYDQPILTPSEQEKNLKDSIERYVRKYAYAERASAKDINREIKAHFNKGRDDMTAEELMHVWAFIQQRYPGVIL